MHYSTNTKLKWRRCLTLRLEAVVSTQSTGDYGSGTIVFVHCSFVCSLLVDIGRVSKHRRTVRMASFLDDIVNSMRGRTPKPSENQSNKKKPKTYILPAHKKQAEPSSISLPKGTKASKKRSQEAMNSNPFDVLEEDNDYNGESEKKKEKKEYKPIEIIEEKREESEEDEDEDDIPLKKTKDTHKKPPPTPSPSSSSSSTQKEQPDKPQPQTNDNQNAGTIVTIEECEKAIKEIKKQHIIAVDCEGVNLGREGTLCLVQVATSKKAYLFDIIEGGSRLFDHGLREILESDKILKVFHDCRLDSDALFHEHKVKMAKVFDTQV
eukprot:TRINITY_DN2194_c0_g1_i4.p1 TRINITY_DN2194_c0_g1~~TRINITY_DN2194_c0_g1_i4.p1  ORF type:complete len:322 (+),score=79.59 TRINITY_DN2194_c0_g1_i4:557-1522(+)